MTSTAIPPSSSVSSSAAAPPPTQRLSLAHSALTNARPHHSLPTIAPSLPPQHHDDHHHPHATAGAGADATPPASRLVNHHTLALATPPPTYVDAQACHLLATEMVYTIIQSSQHAHQKHLAARRTLAHAGLAPAPAAPAADADATASTTTTTATTATDTDALVCARLEAIGFHVGANLAEHLGRERARFTETLDVLKFICKELWTTIWSKQVDNLRTNHRGVYVLQDNAFRPLVAMASSYPAPTPAQLKIFLAYPVGIVRGALAQLDVPSVVVAETSQAPQCTFHVKTQRAAAATAGGTAAAAATATTTTTAARAATPP